MEKQSRVEQMYWVTTTGVTVSLSPEATAKIAHGVNNGGIPEEELHRLNVIAQDPILTKRYPTTEAGSHYMSQVDFAWREQLYTIAQETTEHIVEHAKAMGKEDIAVVLFGSVAKNLVREKDHEDPSNVDLVVIGEFSQEEKDELFDRIRDYRNQKKDEIGNNVGVHIQKEENFRRNSFNEALILIGSSARTMYDPTGRWAQIESEALTYTRDMKRYTKEQRAQKPLTDPKRYLYEVKPFQEGREVVLYRKPTAVHAEQEAAASA